MIGKNHHLHSTNSYSTRSSAALVAKGSIQTKLNIGQPNNAYEREADQIADQVINGVAQTESRPYETQSAAIQPKPLLHAPENQIQRYVFAEGQQVSQADEQPNTTMQAWTADSDVREYKDMAEFEEHSAGNTDYLGILRTGTSPGTWVRFHKEGLNLLGEGHTMVTLQDVVPAVGSTNFIYEAFSTDDFSNNIATGHAYNVDNQERFNTMGIDGAADKRQHGAESTYPKIAMAIMAFNRYLNPDDISMLQSGTDAAGNPNYIGQPFQRYLKIGWAWSHDNMMHALADPEANPYRTKLAEVHTELLDEIDPFFISLQPDGFLGDAIVMKKNKHLYEPLRRFADALKDAILEMISSDPDSPLDNLSRSRMAPDAWSADSVKMFFISRLRDLNILEAVKNAGENGMRYAGMGKAHLDFIKSSGQMQSDWHAYDMVDTDIKKFETRTQKLKSIAE